MLITALFSKLRAYLRYRASIRSLNALTDRQLSDIGLARGNIEGVARDLAFR
jgi:uncharacterized protein YjiS (DUF1127 family)